MSDKYLMVNGDGVNTEVAATTTSAGAGDTGKIVGLNASGVVDLTMMPPGIVPDVKSIVTSEDLSAGDLINVYDVTGTTTARKADATTSGKEATGFVLAASTSPAANDIYFEGRNNQLTGLTAGPLFLDTTAGGVTATPPSSSGNLTQFVGTAISATEMSFEPAHGIIRA